MTPNVNAYWLDEPQLRFGGGNRHIDPKIGIQLYGPRSFGTSRHKSELHISFVGLSESRDRARRFYESIAGGVPGTPGHEPFPGCLSDVGFRSKLILDTSDVGLITWREIKTVLDGPNKKARFLTFLELVTSKLELVSQRDHPCDCIVICISPEVCDDLFSVEYAVPGVGRVRRNMRRTLKGVAMRHRVATQILLDATITPRPTDRNLDMMCDIAWNLMTSLYFKSDGLPWGPTTVHPGSCFIGVTFYRSNFADDPLMRTSCAQAFDEDGDGLVLRGHAFTWNEEKMGKSPHLPEELAFDLVKQVLDRYKRERGRLPSRVVVHKSSPYFEEEREGFERALEVVDRSDLVSLRSTSDARLVRSGQYPPLRGTGFRVGEDDFIYTNGYVVASGSYLHGHVPSPVLVSDHKGDTPKRLLLQEVLELTKMNWNSANMHGRLPITLEFSRVVADILKEIPATQLPEPKYKFYM